MTDGDGVCRTALMKAFRTPRSGLPAALAVAAASAALVVASGMIPPMDDTYIHLVYGRSLLSSNPLCFNEGRPSSGFTSPLWLLPSALASTAAGSAPAALMTLSVLCACTALLLGGASAWPVLLTGPFLFHASSGMETALACLFLALVWRTLASPPSPLRDGMLAAGALLARPELAVLAPLVLVRHRKGGIRGAALALAPAAAASALWIVWNLHAAGRPLPTTFYAKQTAFPPSAAELVSLAWRLAATAPLVMPAAAAGMLSLARRRRPEAFAAPLLLAAALATQPNPWFQLRYYVPALFAAGLTASAWLEGLTDRVRGISRLALLASSLPAVLWFAGLRLRASEDVMHIDILPAGFVASVAAPDETVASADIGAMKWLTGLEVLDLDGLATPERLPGPGRAGWPWIACRADWLVAFPDQYADLLVEADGRAVFTAGFRSPAGVVCGSDSVAVWRVAD